MAHPGPVGKNIKADWIDVPNVPFDGPYPDPYPDLPKLPGRQRWLPDVVDWWECLIRMPHCVLWIPTDWRFAYHTALAYQELFTDYKAGVTQSTKWTEVRRRDDVLGTTAEARRKLRIRYVRVDQVEGQTPEQQAASAVEDEVAKARRRRIAEAS